MGTKNQASHKWTAITTDYYTIKQLQCITTCQKNLSHCKKTAQKDNGHITQSTKYTLHEKHEKI